MNRSSISTAVVLSCAAHIGAFAVFTNTKYPTAPTNEIVFSSALYASLTQEAQDAGETIEPSVTAIEAVENKQQNKASKANERLQDLIQQVDTLQKRLALEHTQQITLRNRLDSEKAQNSLLQEAQQSLRDQYASLESTNRLQTQKIATLEDQTALAVQKSQALLQQHETLLQVQHEAEETNSRLQANTTHSRFQHAQASSLLKFREGQLAETHQSLKSLQQSNSELAKQNLSLITEISVFEDKHDALSNQNNDLRQHLETVSRKNSTLSTEQETLTKRNLNLTKRNLNLNEALDQAEISEKSVSSQLQQSDNTINTLSARIEHMQSKQMTLKDKLDTLEQLNRHLEIKLVAKSSVINTLRNDHRLQLEQIFVRQANMLREANAGVIQENRQLKITTKTLQTSLETAARNNQSLANELAEFRTKSQLLNRQVTELKASPKELNSVNIDQQVRTTKPRSDVQAASALPIQQASKSAPDTGNAEIDFKAKQVAGNPKPVYPHIAFKLGLEGRVLIDLSMSAEGAVEKVRIRDSSGSAALDSAAVRAVKQWRFYPVLRNGKAMPFTDTGHIIFKIKDS